MQVQSLSQEDPQEEDMVPYFSVPAGRIPWVGYSPWGHKESDTAEHLSSQNILIHFILLMYIY